jgi:hypothetical protein
MRYHANASVFQVDVFEVSLKVESRNGVILLPEELHDCKSGLVIDVPELSAHLRNHDAYMGEVQQFVDAC